MPPTNKPSAPTPAPAPIGNAPAPTPAAAPAPIVAGNDGTGSAAPVATATTASSVTAIVGDIPPPVKNTGGRGGQTLYPFDKLEIGQSFGVVGKSIKGMASTVSSANKRFLEEVKDSEGKPVVVDGKTVNKQTRKFICGTVDPAKDPAGASVRVWRVALPA